MNNGEAYLPVSKATEKFCAGVPISTLIRYCEPLSLYRLVWKGSLLVSRWPFGLTTFLKGTLSSGFALTSSVGAAKVTAAIEQSNASEDDMYIGV
jgi:hypothetical protein